MKKVFYTLLSLSVSVAVCAPLSAGEPPPKRVESKIEQITALLDNKRVLAPQKDIIEVRNAIEVYDKLHTFKPYSLPSILAAHKILMNGLIERPGQIRSSTVGIVKDSEVAHLAPPADIVRALLNDRLKYVESDPDILLIKSCVFHYEFEFIHPFTDGNGQDRVVPFRNWRQAVENGILEKFGDGRLTQYRFG